MRHFVLIILISCLSLNMSSAQELSKVDRIYYTCKIWGYLKYYHPLVSKGSYDWDEKMQKALTITANIKTYPAFSDYWSKYIYYMGQIQPCAGCKSGSANSFDENFDLSWTQNNKFSAELKSSLKNIEKNRFQGNHFYIDQGKIGEFIPKNEPQQLDLTWKDENQRLLPLFRYWNYIEYFYPYKYLTEQDWDDVLKEMIPKFLAVNSKLEWHLAMLELIVKIDDSHAGLLTPAIEQMPYHNYIPARIDVVEDQVVVTKIIDEAKAQQHDLQVGDIITKVNGKSAVDLHNTNKKYIWGSNESVKDRSAYHTLFMGLQGSAQVVIDRNGASRNANLTLYKYSDLSYKKTGPEEKWTTPSDSVGYVNLGQLAIGDVGPMMAELMDKTVIIFDVRNSPKGTYRALAKYLNPSDTTFAIYTKPDFTYPGKFIWQGEGKCGAPNEDYYKGKVILLVDENTQAHGEFTCMSLQTAPNVVVVGNETAGTDGKVTNFPIISRLYTAMSGIGVYYPDRSEAQRVGIVPDVMVEPTIEGIREGRDEILEKAMDVAQEEIAMKIAEAKAALAKAALDSIMRADSLMRIDSLRMDSLRMDMMPMDTLQVDTLKVDDGGK